MPPTWPSPLVRKTTDCIINEEQHVYWAHFYAVSPSTAPLLSLRPIFSRSRGPEHHLHLHPVTAPERRGLQCHPAEELPHPGPVSSGPAPAHFLHLPPHRSQVPLHLQPARPFQHIPGDTHYPCRRYFLKSNLCLIFSQCNVRSHLEKLLQFFSSLPFPFQIRS